MAKTEKPVRPGRAAAPPDPTCADDYDPGSLPVGEALRRMHGAVKPLAETETVPLLAARERVAAEDVYSPLTVPGFDNSAMDGYALDGAALPHKEARAFRIAGEARAGHPFAGRLAAAECVRITTGAPLPRGADTVVMQEYAEEDGDTVTIGAGHKRGAFVRAAGQDLREGDRVVAAGRLLDAAALGLLASIGLTGVRVIRKPRVVYFSTGDELRPVGGPLGYGELYDSNRYTLHGMLGGLAIETIDLGVTPDDAAQTRATLERAADLGDAVIATGGASAGDADHVRPMLEQLGRVNFWKIAMKPGRPLSFGAIGDALFFGLPGNPVSVMVTFQQFVLPALRRLMGLQTVRPLRVPARLAAPLRKQAGRMEFQRGILDEGEDGGLRVVPAGSQDSAVLSSMEQANCFIVLPLESGDLETGVMVQVEPFHPWF